MEHEFMWLSIEPFVHGIVKGNHGLLYNTLNKKHLVWQGQNDLSDLVSQLLSPEHGRVIKVTLDHLQNKTIKKFIKSFRRKYMGDLYSPSWSDGKPMILGPEPVIKENNFQLQDFLHEVTIHLDSGPNSLLEPWKNAFYQFPFPLVNEMNNNEMDFTILTSVIDQLTPLPLATIHLIGHHVFRYHSWIQLMEMIKTKQYHLNIHTTLSDQDWEKMIFTGRRTKISLFITPPISLSDQRILEMLAQNQAHQSGLEFNFIAQTKKDVETASEIITSMNLTNSFFKPFYNGSNLDFFESMVFMHPADILSSKPGQKQILSRLLLNENDFGRLTILPDGEVFANVNDHSLGNINNLNLENLVKKEWGEGISWRRKRMDQTPCRQCIYQFLCPPVSNYELFLHKFNFCHIVIE